MQATSLNAASQADVDQFDIFMQAMNDRLQATLADTTIRIFRTDVDGLYDAYLNGLDESERQYHTCHCCRQFIQNFGGLATINVEGVKRPLLWDSRDAPDMYLKAASEMYVKVQGAKVTGPFYAKEAVLGTPVTGEWRHFAFRQPTHLIHKDRVKTPYQAEAEKIEDYRTMSRALSELSLDTVNNALTIAQSETLQNSERIVGPAQWLAKLRKAWGDAKGRTRANVLWYAVTVAPPGFAHPRSSMIGTLLEDLGKGMPFAEVKARFDAKMHPLQYQRPSAPPSAGNIAASEKLVEQLGIANSLRRRHATFPEVKLLWNHLQKPPMTKANTGVFDILKETTKVEHRLPAKAMSWEKFNALVLHKAEAINLVVGAGRNSYAGLLTAEDYDAPPILQWDTDELRNQVSWYLHSGGSTPASFNIPIGRVKVKGVTLMPNMWNGGYEHVGKGVMFLVEGAYERNAVSSCLFPSFLKSELHSARSTIEAFSNRTKIAPQPDNGAAGLLLQNGTRTWQCEVEVLIDGMWHVYKLDRWE